MQLPSGKPVGSPSAAACSAGLKPEAPLRSARLGLFATGSGDETARLWKAHDSGEAAEVATLKLHTDSVSAAAFSADSGLLATRPKKGKQGFRTF